MLVSRTSAPLLLVALLGAVVFASGATPDSEAYLIFTGGVQGTFEPCGCAGGPDGGLARRVGYSRQVEKERGLPQFQLDAGNYFAPPGEQADPINRLMIESLSRIPLSVLNLGVEDLYWWDQLSRLSGDTQIISTNLVPRRPSIPAPQKYAILDVPLAAGSPKKSIRIGVLGLVDPMRVKPNSGFRAVDPLRAVRNIKEEVLAKADFLIVLIDLIRPQRVIPSDWVVKRLAEENEEIYLVVTTESRFVMYEPIRFGSALVTSTVERGRYLAEVKLTVDPAGKISVLDPDFVEMKDGTAEDPDLLNDQRSLSARLR